MKTRILQVPSWLLFIVGLSAFFTMEFGTRVWLTSTAVAAILLAGWATAVVYLLTNQSEWMEMRAKFLSIVLLTLAYIMFLAFHELIISPETIAAGRILPIIILGHFFLMYSFAYLVKTISVTIAKKEFKRDPEFREYLIHIVELVFFPIGIWFLNPTIKQILQEDE